MRWLFNFYLVVMRKINEILSKRYLARDAIFWADLNRYIAKSKSTGCSYTDYAELHKALINLKPKEVLELGSGVTTLVIANALMRNYFEFGITGRVTSLEENVFWMAISKKLLPCKYNNYVDMIRSDTVDDSYSLFRGVRYSNIPERKYEFVFIDGPKYTSKKDSSPTFDLDFIHVLSKLKSPVSGLIDKRLSTVFVLQKLLGFKKVTYSVIKGLGYIKAVSKDDLGNISKDLSSKNFEKSFKLFGTKLDITSNYYKK
jgi:hypothetical protein